MVNCFTWRFRGLPCRPGKDRSRPQRPRRGRLHATRSSMSERQAPGGPACGPMLAPSSFKHLRAPGGRSALLGPVARPRPGGARVRAPQPPRALPAPIDLQFQLPAMPFLSSQEAWALALTTFAGLSTCIGAGFAVRSVMALWVCGWLARSIARTVLPPVGDVPVAAAFPA